MEQPLEFGQLPDRFNALVVGGGGIGHALAEQLHAHAQCQYLDVAGRHSRCESADSQHAIDFAEPDSAQHLADSVAAHSPRLHLVVICTGLLHQPPHGPEKSLDQVKSSTLEQAFAVNAIGPLQLLQSLLPLLTHDEPSLIAALSARVGSIEDNRLGGWYSYRASKAALNQLWKTAAIELGRRRRHPTCVLLHPGTVDTPLSRPFQANVPPERLFEPARASKQLLTVMAGVTRDDNGRFFAWDGAAIPW